MFSGSQMASGPPTQSLVQAQPWQLLIVRLIVPSLKKEVSTEFSVMPFTCHVRRARKGGELHSATCSTGKREVGKTPSAGGGCEESEQLARPHAQRAAAP